MNPTRRFLGSQFTAACIIGLAIIGGAAIHTSAKPALGPAPVSIAMIDLQKLTDGLDEFKARNAANRQKGDDFQKKLKEMSDEIDHITKDLNELIPKDDIKRRTKAISDRYELSAMLKARKDMYQNLYDVDHGDIIHELYDKITLAVADIAKREGYDIVLLDDRGIQLLPIGTATDKDLGPIIESKRILFARDGMDITSQVMTKMNNDYSAGVKAAPAGADAPKPDATKPNTPPATNPK